MERRKAVNFRGTCDLPPLLSQTTASVNKEGEKKMYRGKSVSLFFPLFFIVPTVGGRRVQSDAGMSSRAVDLRKPEELIDDFHPSALSIFSTAFLLIVVIVTTLPPPHSAHIYVPFLALYGERSAGEGAEP